MSNVSYVNKSNPLQVVVALPAGTKLLSLKAEGMQQFGIAPDAYYNISAIGMDILPFSVVPTVQGLVNIGIRAEIAYGNGTVIRNMTVESFAVLQGSNITAPTYLGLSASIDRHNESVLYGVSNAIPIYTVSMWSHCSFVNMWFQQRPIQYQCGNANWYFFGDDPYCYWNNGGLPITYCVELTPTNTSIRQVQGRQSYAYNITVSLSNTSTALHADINGTATTFSVLGADGKSHGNASVTEVNGAATQGYGSYSILNTTSSRWQANASDYSAYQQALNNLDSVMAYYNNTSGNVETISEAMEALNSASSGFVTSAPAANVDNCNIVVQGPEWHYACAPLSPLYYDIDARLNLSGVVHQLLSVQGTTINVT